MTQTAHRNAPRSTVGATLHSAFLYDLQVWLATLGRERALREEMLRLARVQPGEAILDVGCGTGTLAIAAKREVGPRGTVYGIDPSPQILARAEKKARKAGLEVVFMNAIAQSLPFPDARFDAVLSTVMLHHLASKARTQCAAEMRRVLRPGGRVLVVEFGLAAREQKGPLARFHKHGHVKVDDVVDLLRGAGLQSIESGPVGIRDLQFVVGGAPCSV